MLTISARDVPLEGSNTTATIGNFERPSFGYLDVHSGSKPLTRLALRCTQPAHRPTSLPLRRHTRTARAMASAQSVQKVCACRWALLAVLFLSVPVPGLAQGDWRYGRATFYGDEPWYWDIHYGSCAHDYIWPDQSTGWDVAALADTHPDYSGSCGSCYEIQCSNGNFRDGYGADLDRSGMCHSGSVIVKVTDTCPCNYPNNYYSNKRWCCGDMPHFDLSVWAFEKIADKKWGVISIKYRKVDCSYTPEQRAWADSTTMPVFPTSWQAMPRKDNFDWYKYFPNGGWTNHRDGQCYQLSTSDYLKKIGKY